ncbi:MAG: AAA family ATPase, partial [Mycobacteriales bacterium]
MILGRASELGVLRRLCRSAAAGAGGAVLVEGLAGVGKTTLLRALVGEAEGLQVLWGRAPEEGRAPAFWPWREIAAVGG